MSKAKAKTKKPPAPRRLPDSRLRMERRPAWMTQEFGMGAHLSPYNLGAHALAVFDDIGSRIIEASAQADHPIITFTDDKFGGWMKRCRVCHCTDANCRGCIALTGSPCSWSDEDATVCTACVKPKAGGK
jgi:hypothetical protein